MSRGAPSGAGSGAGQIVPLTTIVLALAFGCNFIGRGLAETWAVFLLPIEAEFGFSRVQVTSVYSTYLFVAGLAAPFSGMAFDRFGPRFCYLLGMACVAFGTFAAGWAQARWHFILANGITLGIGASLIGMVPASVMLGRWFHVGLGRAVAFGYAGFGTGILLMVPLSQFLIERFGWRDAYHALGAGLLAVGIGLALLPWRRIAAGSPEVAWLRAAEATARFEASRAARGEAAAGSGPGGPAGKAASPATGAARAASGPGFREALRSPAFWDLAVTFHLTAVGMYLVIPQVVAYLVDTGYSPLLAASVFGIAGSLSMGGILAAGWLCDRVGFRFAATLSFLLTLAGTGCLAMLLLGPSPLWLVGFVLLFGLAQGARGPVVSTLTNRIFAGPSAGTIYGVIFAVMSIGSAIGAWASGELHDATGGYGVNFALSAACIAGAAAPFWWASRLRDVRAR